MDRLCADRRVGGVGGLIDPIATGPVSRANSIARFSVLGVGRGPYTTARTVQEVDTVQCGVYRREALEAVGGFDGDLQFGEDESVALLLAAWRSSCCRRDSISSGVGWWTSQARPSSASPRMA